MKAIDVLSGAGKLEEVKNGEMCLVVKTDSEDLAEAVVCLESDSFSKINIAIRRIIDLQEEVDFEEDIFFLMTTKTYEQAKDSTILWDSYFDKGKDIED
jgi:hypothetical protein